MDLLPQQITSKLAPNLAKAEALSSKDREVSQAQAMALTAFCVRIISAAIAFFSHVLFARLIGQFDYGIYAFIWVLVVIFGNLSCLGYHTTLIRFLPLYERGNLQGLYRGLLFSSKLVAIGVASTVAVIGLILLQTFGEEIGSYYLIPSALALLTLPLIALGDMLDGTARANGWPLVAMQYTYLVRPILVIVAMVLAIALGAEPSATAAMQAAFIATLITTLVQLNAVQRRLGHRNPRPEIAYQHRQWLNFALPMFFIDGIGFLLTNADVIIVGLYLPPDQVAIYFAAAKTIVLMQFVFFAVKAAAGPRFAKLIADGNSTELKDAARQIARWSFWPSLAMGLLLLITGPWLLSLFGKGFAVGYSLIFILFFGFLIKSAIGPTETLLNMAGKQFLCVWLYVIIFVTNVTLNIILIPMYGLEGAAIATSLAMALETLLLFSAARHQLGIWISPLPLRLHEQFQNGGHHGK